MNNEPSMNIVEYFEDLDDPRIDRRKLHLLIDIVVITICAVICAAETWEDIEDFGKEKEGWLRKYLKLPHGIPAHDTYRRLFVRLNPQELQERFLSWTQALSRQSAGEVIAIDGKTLRHSYDREQNKAAIHMVSAWATQNRLVLAQKKVDEKSNEITAIPELLKVLELSGCIVSIDAMGAQKQIAEQIVKEGAEYVLALKGNQSTLHENVKEFFEHAHQREFRGIPHDYYRSFEKDHGRFETREYWTVSDLQWLEEKKDWAGLKSIGMVRSQRTIQEQTTSEIRYYFMSLPSDAQRFGDAVRQHWGIENSLHWILDVTFHEDASRMQRENSPENFAVLRHIALNLLKRDQSSKRSVRGKRLKAAWSTNYLERVLFEN